jgi:hypothetical protein
VPPVVATDQDGSSLVCRGLGAVSRPPTPGRRSCPEGGILLRATCAAVY